MTGYKVRDEVRVFMRNRYVDEPEGGFVGEVTKVGRRYATAVYERASTNWRHEPETRTVAVEFDMDTGYERGDHNGNGLRVMTPEQLMLDQRRAAAALEAAGVEIQISRERFVTLEQIEALAEVVKGWED